MSGTIASIVGAVSEDVVAALAAAGYPPLTPDASGNAGKILVGTAAMFEQTSPPRIIFEPRGSKFGVAEYASASATLDTLERQNQTTMRTIAAEDLQFVVRCWGAAPTGDITDDYDVTRAMYHQVRASLQKLLPGAFRIDDSGTYPAGSNVHRHGREYVFGLTILTPVLDALAPYAFVNYTPAQQATEVAKLHPSGPVTVVGTERFINPAGVGSGEPGCE